MAVLPPDACSVRTEAAGEPLAGTASTDGATYFLVRYAGAWAKKAVEGSDLPDALKARLAEATRATAGRALLVRGPARDEDPPELFVVRTVPGERFALRVRAASHAALAEIDLVELAARGAHPGAERVDEPLFLVCTHGKRDACCAARGGEVFRAIAGMRPGRVLQTSHLGGHRFAATALSLPDGLCYGRLSPGDAARWVDATEQGEVFDVARLRGRTCFDAPAQAAEIFLRAAIAETAIDGVALESVERRAPDAKAASVEHRVILRAGGARHEVVVAEETMTESRPASCGAEPEPATRFVLRVHRALAMP